MSYFDETITKIKEENILQKEYLQALDEISSSLIKVMNQKEIEELNLLPRLFSPDNIIILKIKWRNDLGEICINNGYRIQHCNLLGPYKGGLRLNKSVNISILKFLALEQTFKNALTGLPLGGAKGGSDFDPHGKSDNEIKNFCKAFMKQLARHLGATYDVPAGDLGVGEKEIRYLYEQYKVLKGEEKGVLTGKPLDLGGSLIRKEATGYGLLYFVANILKSNNIELKDRRCIISGAGNVALYALKKANELGLKVIGISNSKGYIIDESGINFEQLIHLLKDNILSSYPLILSKGNYFIGSIYDHQIPYEIVLPCATQNEIDLNKAKNIVNNGCFLVAEGANMPSSNEAIAYYHQNKIIFAPGKAANAGGVSVSYFEMVQNANNEKWSAEKVDKKLYEVMKNIHDNCRLMCKKYQIEENNYLFGANAFAYERLLRAIKDEEFNKICGRKIDLIFDKYCPTDPQKDYVPTYKFNIVLHDSDEIIGCCDARVGFNQNIYYGGNIGYFIGSEYRGNGYAVEAVNLLKKIYVSYNIDKIYITNNVNNHASFRVCEKLGAKFIIKEELPLNNEMRRENGMTHVNIFELKIQND